MVNSLLLKRLVKRLGAPNPLNKTKLVFYVKRGRLKAVALFLFYWSQSLLSNSYASSTVWFVFRALLNNSVMAGSASGQLRSLSQSFIERSHPLLASRSGCSHSTFPPIVSASWSISTGNVSNNASSLFLERRPLDS